MFVCRIGEMLGSGRSERGLPVGNREKKIRNLERDPRACVAISKPVTMAHVIVWGTIEIRRDAEAQLWWEEMIVRSFGPDGLGKRARQLSADGTSLGVMTPTHHRIYGLNKS